MFKAQQFLPALILLVPAADLQCQADLSAEEALIRTIQAERRAVSAARARIMGPVTVNGVKLQPDFVKREVVYLTAANMMQQKQLEFIVEDWKKRFIADKFRKPEHYKIDFTKIEKILKDGMSDFRKQYPTLDFWEVVRAQNGVSKEQYMHQLKVTAMFDKVFMDGPPDKWPEITREAIMAGSQGGNPKDFWDSLVKNGYGEDGSAREMPAMWKQMIRTMVVRQMQNWTDTKYAADGLDPKFIMEVEGIKWSTEDAFNDIKENVFLQDLERAYTEVVVCEAIRQELEKHGCLPTDAEFKKAYDAHAKEFEGTLFNINMIAVAFKGYPTVEAYRNRWKLMHGFEKLIAKEINDETLGNHFRSHHLFFNDGKVNVDLISFLGKDPKSGAWRSNGMTLARQKAEEAMKLIQAGASFDETLAKHGEYFFKDDKRGRLGPRSLNDLRKQLRESEYTDIVTGVSLGYYLFYKAPVGKVIGPVKGADAYYLIRVNHRSPTNPDARLTEGSTRELAKQDYVSVRFFNWVNEVLARSKVE